MPRKTPAKIPRRLALRQEAVFENLHSLARAIQSGAARSPARAVPEDLRIRAEALLFAAQAFHPGRRGSTLPEAAPHLSGLAMQLGEALTRLIAFETRHSQWNAVLGETVWSVDGPVMRLKRLRPRPGSRAAAHAEAKARQEADLRAARNADLRQKLILRLDQYKSRTDAPSYSPLSPSDRTGL